MTRRRTSRPKCPPQGLTLYATVADDATTTDVNESHTENVVSGYNNTVWVPTIDDDFDPIYGDLGKVDTSGDDEANNFVDADDSNECTADDGGTAKGRNLNNGTLCDAADVEIEATVTFPLGLGYGCDAVEKTYTLTCNWNTRGTGNNVVGVSPSGHAPLPARGRRDHQHR